MSNRDLDSDVLTDPIPPLTPAQVAAAARAVTTRVTDPDEARTVLHMLGILDALRRQA